MGIHDSVMDPSFSNTNSEARPCKQLFAESLEIYSIRYIYYSYLCQTIFEVPFEFFKHLFLSIRNISRFKLEVLDRFEMLDQLDLCVFYR